MTQYEVIQIITGFLGSLGFTVLFNIRGKRMLMSALGGFLSWALFVVLGFAISDEPIRYFIVAALISVYAEIMARVLKTPTTTLLMTSLIPLIPGGSLYYTMAYVLEGNQLDFLERASGTLQMAAALALGIVMATGISRAWNNKKREESQKMTNRKADY